MTTTGGKHDSEVSRLFREGESFDDIAAAVGVDVRSVYRILERTGDRVVEHREMPTLSQKMLDLLEDGASYAEVAETFAVGVGWLRKAAPGFGWDGKISGSFARALKNPKLREMYREIQRMEIAL